MSRRVLGVRRHCFVFRMVEQEVEFGGGVKLTGQRERVHMRIR